MPNGNPFLMAMHLKDSRQHCVDCGEGGQVGDGWVEVEEGTKGINSNGKITIKVRRKEVYTISTPLLLEIPS